MTPSVSRLYGVDDTLFDEYGAVSGKITLELSNPALVQRVAGISTRNTNWDSEGKLYL